MLIIWAIICFGGAFFFVASGTPEGGTVALFLVGLYGVIFSWTVFATVINSFLTAIDSLWHSFLDYDFTNPGPMAPFVLIAGIVAGGLNLVIGYAIFSYGQKYDDPIWMVIGGINMLCTVYLFAFKLSTLAMAMLRGSKKILTKQAKKMTTKKQPTKKKAKAKVSSTKKKKRAKSKQR